MVGGLRLQVARAAGPEAQPHCGSRRTLMKRWHRSSTLALPVAVAVAAVLTVLPSLPGFAAPGDTTRASVASDGTQGNSDSHGPSISADGRFVAFWSSASNLV